MRISPPYSNLSVKGALAYRSRILEKSLRRGADLVKVVEISPYGEDAKMVSRIIQVQKILSPNEKDEAIRKYESGMTIAAVAHEYGCHRTTVGRIIKKRDKMWADV